MLRALKKLVLKDIILEFKDIKSMLQLNQLHQGYLPWSGASVRPTALVYLLNDIIINDRNTIAECGSGLSTMYIASLFKQLGIREKKIYSIDHDAGWLKIIERELKKYQLDEYVHLIHAPLSSTDISYKRDLEWYDTAILDRNMPENSIDLLFVDGPPAKKKGYEWSRYPALPYFKDRLSDDFAVIVDDADRKGEAFIVKKWQEKFKLEFDQCILKGNIYIGGKNNAYTI